VRRLSTRFLHFFEASG